MSVGSGNTLADFLVRLSYSVDQMSANATLQSLSSFSGQLSQLARSAANVTSIIAREMFRSMNEISQIDRTAERLGMRAAELDSITMATQIAGGNMQDVMGSLQSLSTKLGEGFLRLGGGAETFRKLGISVYNSRKEMKSMGELLVIISKRFNAVLGDQKFNASARNALAKQLGITPELARVLTNGFDEAMGKYLDFANAFNYNIDTMSKKTENLRREWQTTHTIFKMLRRSMNFQVLDSFSGRVSGLNKSMLQHAIVIGTIKDGIAKGIELFMKLIWAIVFVVGKALTLIVELAGPLGKLTSALITFGAIMASVLGIVAMINPHLAAIIASVLGVVVAIEDLFVYMEGGNSLGILKPFWNFLAIILLIMETLGDFIGMLMDWSWALYHLFTGDITAALKDFSNGIDRMFSRKHYFDVIVKQNFSDNPDEKEKSQFIDQRLAQREKRAGIKDNSGELFNKSTVNNERVDQSSKGSFYNDKFIREIYEQNDILSKMSGIGEVLKETLSKMWNWLNSPSRLAEYFLYLRGIVIDAVKTFVDKLIEAITGGEDSGKLPTHDHKFPGPGKPKPVLPRPRPRLPIANDEPGNPLPIDPSKDVKGKAVKPVMRDFNGIQYQTPEGFSRVFGDKSMGAEGSKLDRAAYKRWTGDTIDAEKSWEKDTGLGIESFPEPRLESNAGDSSKGLVASLGGLSGSMDGLNSTLSLKGLTAAAGHVFNVKQEISMSPHIEIHGASDQDAKNKQIAAQLEIADTVASRTKGYFNPDYYPAT